MRFLVTADVHLAASHPERLEALEAVAEEASELDVDYLLIAGDLFDAAADVEELKPEVREVFSDNSFHSFVIPGNHDADSYRDEDYFGDDVDVLRERPFEAVDFDGMRLFAVPYTTGGFDDVVDDVRDTLSRDGVNALLMHGTLSTETGGYGGEERYLPFTPEQLLEAGVDVVLAGHIHSEPSKQVFGDDDVELVYPGSPVSITRGETGPRGAWLYDSVSGEVSQVELPTQHYLVEEVTVVPGEEDKVLDSLRRRLKSRDLEHAEVVVEATGYVEGRPEEFLTRLEDTVCELDPRAVAVDRGGVENASEVVDTDLYREFETKLESRGDVEVDVDHVKHLTLKALSKMERA